MWTACTYNFWNGTANDCVVDKNIHADEDGYYTLLVTEAQNRPSNAAVANHITWLDAGRFRDGQISFRLLPKDTPFLQALAESIENDMASTYRPETAFCSRQAFEQGGFSACRLEK